MDDKLTPRALAAVFKAIADETRLQMLALLLDEPELCVCHFENILKISQSKASRHLRYLLNARLLDDRREGVWIHYRLAENMGPKRLIIVNSIGECLNEESLVALRQKLAESRQTAPGARAGACCPAGDPPGPAATRPD